MPLPKCARPDYLKRFALARVRRIYPPYWACAVLVILISLLMQALAARGLPHTTMFSDIRFFGHGPLYYFATFTLTQKLLHQDLLLGIYWTLSYEVAFYAIMALTLAATARAVSPRALLWALHALTVFALGWLIVRPETCPFPLDLWPQFGLGIPAAANRLWFCLVVAGLLVVLHRFDARLMQAHVIRPSAWVGGFSYSLYLTHLCIIPFVRQILAKVGLSTPGTLWLSCLVQLIAALVLARIFFLIAERPFLRRRVASSPRVIAPTLVAA